MRILEETLRKICVDIPSETNIAKVVMDSRLIENNSLFFAINSGNTFVKDALEKGASLVICDRDQDISDSRIIKVENTVEFMQKAAREYRKNLNIKVIGITGSNGKTTTKDILYTILSKKYKVKKTIGNNNNAIGVPYTLLQLEEDDEIIVLEMGMSALGEIDNLCQTSLPDYGIITNIGDSHLEFLKTRENVFRAKTEMIKYIDSKNLFVCGDDIYLQTVNGTKIGFNENNNIIIKDYKEENESIEFSVNCKNKQTSYIIDLNGRHNCLDTVMAIAVARKLKVNDKQIQKALKETKITPMRFEKIEKNGILYINDAYNASPVSMRCSIETFSNLYKDYKKIAVLGDMLELGENEIVLHKDLLKDSIETDINEFFIFGPRIRKALDMLEKSDKAKFHYFLLKEDIKEAIEKEKKSGEKLAILVKGSRGMTMEEII
jgi:UDP-N-acetylmuramoyl-tripeptide--D-alanyl-D-alanine ligase